MTDPQLQLALAKMLPEKLRIVNGLYRQFFEWNNTRLPVEDTEWLHVCWMIEQTLGDKINQYIKLVEVSSAWQKRAEALCKVKRIIA